MRLCVIVAAVTLLFTTVGCGPPTTGGNKPKGPGEIGVALGSSVSFTVATPKDTELSVAPLPLPPGMTFDLEKQKLTFTPVPAQAGELFDLVFTATKADGSTGSSLTKIVVTSAPDGGSTAIRGQIFDSGTAQPLSNVALTIPLPNGGALSATTDLVGRFEIEGLPVESDVLVIDGGTADQGTFAFVVEKLELVLGHMLYEGQVNVVDRPIFLPALGKSAGQLTNGGGVLQSAAVPEVGVQVSFGSARLSDGTTFSGDIFIPEVGVDFTPAALPPNLNPSLVVAIQAPAAGPGLLTFSPPAQISFPNRDDLAPFTEVDIWSIDAESGTFEIAGTGRVNVSGELIETVEGGIASASWHFPLPAAPQTDTTEESKKNNNQNPDEAGQCPAASSVEAFAGALMLDHSTPAYWSGGEERFVRLNYHSGRASPRPVLNADLGLASNVAVPLAFSATLSIAGLTQPYEVFTQPALGKTRVGVQFDASSFPTGIFPYCLTATSHYQDSSVASDSAGTFLVHSEVDSFYGRGWMLDGIERLHPVAGSDQVVITGGDGSAVLFTPQSPLTGSLRVELVFCLDGSGSITASDWSVLRQGIAEAILDPSTVPPDGSVAVAIVQFGNSAQVQIPRTVIDSPVAAGALASQVLALPKFGGGTNTAAGIAASTDAIAPGDAAAKQVICVVTDGAANSQLAAFEAAQAAIAAGIEEIDVIGVGAASAANLSNLQQLAINGFASLAANFQAVASAVAEKFQLLVGGAPSGEFSYTVSEPDGGFTRVYLDGQRSHFNSDGWMMASEDRNSNRTVFEYDDLGRPIRIIDPVGRVTFMRYAGDLLSEIEDPVGRITRLQHTGRDLTRIIEVDGTDRRFDYDGSGRIVTHTNHGGNVARYAYSPLGRIESIELPDGSTRSYTAGDVQALVADPSTTSIQFPAPSVTTGSVVSTYTDELGRTDILSTDGFGRFTSAEDALGRVTLTERDSDGLPTLITGANDARVRMTYDLRGNVTSLVEEGNTGSTSDDRTWLFSYESTFNQLRSVIDPLGQVNPVTGVTTKIERDAQGNATLIVDAVGTETELVYDESGANPSQFKGLVTRRTEARGQPEERTTHFRYDSSGQMVEIQDSVGRRWTWGHDSTGRVVAATAEGASGDPTDNRTFDYTYDSRNRVIGIADPIGGNVAWSFDARGNLLSSQDGKSPAGTIQYTYDVRDRVTSRRDQVGAVETFTYDQAGNLTRFVDRRGSVFTLTYDVVNRLISREFPGEPGTTGNDLVSYAYDANADGNPLNDLDWLSRVADSDSVVGFAWNSFDELVSTTTAGSALQPNTTITYEYDRNGRRTRAQATGIGLGTFSDVTYGYDSLDRLVLLQQFAGSMNATFQYDRLSQRRSLRRTFSGTTIDSLLAYDSTGSVTSLEHRLSPKAASQLLSSFTYANDAFDNRVSLVQQRPALPLASMLADFVHDGLQRLTAVSASGANGEGYTYDEAGNRLTSIDSFGNASYDSANRLLEDSEYLYTYDGNGNRTTRRLKADPTQSVFYSYDGDNRLVAYVAATGEAETYAYDGIGRRIQQVRSDALGVVLNTRTFVLDGGDQILDRDSGALGTVDRVETHGAEPDEVLFRREGSDTRAILTDARLSVTEEVAPGGDVTSAASWATFGELLASSGAPQADYYYAGRSVDGISGLVYIRARHYDPRSGVFIQEDPARADDIEGWSAFTYALNQTTSVVDRDGLLPVWVPWAVGGAIKVCIKLCPKLVKALKKPKPKFPGLNPTKGPKGTKWTGRPGSKPGSKDGNFYNPKTGESYRPDLEHGGPIGPHWDYKDPTGQWWRIFPDGSKVLK